MKSGGDPKRWAEPGSEAPLELAAAMRALRAVRGSAQEVEALGRRLAPQLAAPTQAPAGGALAAATWSKAALALLVLAAIGFYAFTQLSREPAVPAPARRAQPVEVTPAVKPPAAAVPSEQPAPALEAEPRPSTRPASRPRAVPAAGARALAPLPAPPPPPAPEQELVLLQRSQSALDRDPGAALALAEQHARDYPQGVFAQEREILAIEALLKLKQRPAALARAELFLRHHPESPHSTRVRALLDRSRALAPATIDDGSAHPTDVPVPGGGGHDAK